MYLPPGILELVAGAEASPVLIGESGASVLRLRAGERVLFLKTSAAEDGDGLQLEAQRLRWLTGKLAAPEVVAFVQERGRDYLLLTGVPGLNGVEAGREDAASVATGLAQALEVLHAQPIDACPFDQALAAQIERARQRVAAGLVDETDFDEERIGRTAQELLIELEQCRPSDEALRLTHGDACLPNVMFDEGRFSGFVDCGRVGVADPYQDLALAARSIAFNLGPQYVALFFTQYGLPEPDERRLAFYRLLDELF